VIVRPATEADLLELVAMQEPAAVAGLGHIFPQDTHPFPRDAVLQRWRAELADPEVDVSVAVTRTADGAGDGRIIGFAATRGNELLHFGTALDTWGTGVATELHDAVLAGLRAHHPDAAEARLRVFEANTRARRFYERLG
jgi:RimJ/RimL family protein N-acetyltransferase